MPLFLVKACGEFAHLGTLRDSDGRLFATDALSRCLRTAKSANTLICLLQIEFVRLLEDVLEGVLPGVDAASLSLNRVCPPEVLCETYI